jgi:hypothetical protein
MAGYRRREVGGIIEHSIHATMPAETTSPLPDEHFRSRVDAWILVLVLGIQVGGLWLAMASPTKQAGLGKGAGVAIMIVSTALVLLRYGKWAFVMISPPDRDAFIAALRRRVPNLVVGK